MKKYLLPLSFLTFCSPKIAEKSVRQTSPVVIDGSTSEYGRMRFYNPDAKLLYNVSNDVDNLYLCITTSDEVTQRQIMLAGMEVWIDTTKKATQRTGVRYPLKMSEMEVPVHRPSRDPNQKPDFSQFRQRFLMSQKVAEVKGFKNMPDGLTPLETAEGFKMGMGWDKNDILVYEIQVPLKSWYRNLSFSDSTKIFTLTVKINALQLPSGSPPQVDGLKEPPSGMGGGFPGGGPPGGGPPLGASDPMAAMAEAHSFTMNFKLVTNEK